MYHLWSKGKASDKLLQFVCRFEKQSGHPVTAVHTDGRTEFTRALNKFDNEDADVTVTTPFTPESNGLAERTHAGNTSPARTRLQESKLPQSLWHHARRYVADAYNTVRHLLTKKFS